MKKTERAVDKDPCGACGQGAMLCPRIPMNARAKIVSSVGCCASCTHARPATVSQQQVDAYLAEYRRTGLLPSQRLARERKAAAKRGRQLPS